jgi:beta-lactamase regulating signal transducer with metallopeptidase domain
MLSAIDLLVGRPFAEALGWALVHSLWQDALVAALAAVALATLCRTAADVRYVVASLALTLMLALPAVTAWTTFAALAPGASLAAQTAEAGGPPAPALEAPVPAGGAMASIATPAPGARLHRWFSVVVLTWLAGVFVLSLRLLAGWLIVQRLRLRAASPAPAALGAALARLIRRLHLRRPIALRLSGAVDVPTVIGWLKPILLLPASALAGLSPEHLEAILAHELAHVRRHDYLVNLLQSVVETLLFYHPAVWWISRRVRIEREHCCDDLAVSLCGDPVRYAHALAALERWRGERPALALAASGGSLVARIRRLLGAPAAHDGRARRRHRRHGVRRRPPREADGGVGHRARDS